MAFCSNQMYTRYVNVIKDRMRKNKIRKEEGKELNR